MNSSLDRWWSLSLSSWVIICSTRSWYETTASLRSISSYTASINFSISLRSMNPSLSRSYKTNAFSSFFSARPGLVSEILKRNSSNSMVPVWSVSNTLKICLQNLSALPPGNRKVYVSMNLSLVMRPDGQSFWIKLKHKNWKEGVEKHRKIGSPKSHHASRRSDRGWTMSSLKVSWYPHHSMLEWGAFCQIDFPWFFLKI